VIGLCLIGGLHFAERLDSNPILGPAIDINVAASVRDSKLAKRTKRKFTLDRILKFGCSNFSNSLPYSRQ
jgi:hypothetical protein